MNPSGSALAYAGFLGGSGNDAGEGIAVDEAGNAYVTGYTTSTAATFPGTAGVFQPANAGGYDAFVAKVNPSGSALVYAGFLGGSGGDVGRGIAVDGAGDAYVTGSTSSTAATFPGTAGVFQPANAGSWSDAFVAKIADPNNESQSHDRHQGLGGQPDRGPDARLGHPGRDREPGG
ncbi:MAG: SBBP repeat-containing protein [Actinomycetota bacterium]|nr:SBBP repeat-containing protein [Actinomycetota bacterium]